MGGTLFLDEIGDVSPMLQVRLLKVLQDKVYEPLGSSGVAHADVRIVAATNKNLEQLTAGGDFRRDLYYRVNVVKLSLPPLRERKDDIPLLIDHFIRKFNRLNGKEIQGISPEALPLLMTQDFPGNVRELENILEFASVVCRNHVIGVEHLPESISRRKYPELKKRPEENPGRRLSLDDLEKQYVYEALRQNDWSRKATASQMGIHPTTLWRKIKRQNIVTPDQDGRSRR